MTQELKTILLSIILFIPFHSFSQVAPFELSIEPINIANLGGLQSYVFGQSNGKWLIVGGRLDGLHRRQPWASFDLAGHNNQLIVVDPVSLQTWTAPLSSLSSSIQEQLSSTNMEFYQVNDYLYCIGGYGYSATIGDHTTFPNLTAIKISEVINAVISGNNFSNFFRQITDQQFQVTGGRLKRIHNTYYLLGGQKFLGRYNPMGPNHGPGFIQEYTDAIRIFTLTDDGTNIIINHLPSHIDHINLHRRDYNAEQQILPNGEEGVTMFSGVFQHNANLPFLNSVTVDSMGYNVNNSFQQYYNHYHCPVLPIYSESNNEMHTVFFGGIAQFYDSLGTLVQDNNVPFVNTIARVTRDGSGNMTEYKLPIVMPALLGAGAEFIPNKDFPHFNNEVFKLDSVTTDSILIGHIFGGISSTQPNIFFINNGSQSSTNSQIFKVFIKKTTNLSLDKLNTSSTNSLNLNIYPNPNNGILNISFHLSKQENVKLSILSSNGSLIHKVELDNLNIGKNVYSQEIEDLKVGASYLISLETSTQRITHKLIIER